MLLEALGGGIGAIGSEVGQKNFNPLGILDAPRRMIFDALNDVGVPLGETGSDAVQNILGIEKGGWANPLLGFGVDMLLDPLNYVGGFAGTLGGRALRLADQGLAARRTMQNSIGRFEKIGQSVKEAMGRHLAGPSNLPPMPIAPHKMVYKQNILDNVVSPLGKTPAGWDDFTHTYNRVHPAVSKQMETLGLASPMGDAMAAAGKPPIMFGRGGVMKPANLDDPLWRINSYADTLTSPELRAASLRSPYAGVSSMPSLSTIAPNNPHLGFRVPVNQAEVALGSLPADQALMAIQGKIAGVDELMRQVPETQLMRALQTLGF